MNDLLTFELVLKHSYQCALALNLQESSRNFFREIKIYLLFNPQAPVAPKIADELVFRRFQGEGVEFFKIGPH